MRNTKKNRKQRKKSKSGRGVGILPSTNSSQEQGVELGIAGNLSTNQGSQDENEEDNKVSCDIENSSKELRLSNCELKGGNMKSQVAVEPWIPQEVCEDFMVVGPKNKKREKTVKTECLDTKITCSVTNQLDENTVTSMQENCKTGVEISHTGSQLTSPRICEDEKVGPRILNVNAIPVQNNGDKLSSTNLLHTESHILEISHTTTVTPPNSKKSSTSKKKHSKSQEKLNGSCCVFACESNESETLNMHTESNVSLPTSINNSLNEEREENSWDVSNESLFTESPEDKHKPSKDQLCGSSSKRKGKTKWTKLDIEFWDFNSESKSDLFGGRVYDATVFEMNKYSFVALVKESLKVFVYNNQFYPRGAKQPLEQNMPVACFLKIGDCVKLRVANGRTRKKDWKGWLAQECWQEEYKNGAESRSGEIETEGQSIIISVGKRSAQLANGTVICADVMFLYGFHLAHDQVNLEDIFQPGDTISYILHHDHTQRSNPRKVAKAWYGSLPANVDDKPCITHQHQFELMNFFKTRTKGIPMAIVTSVCRLNKKSEATEDGFEDLYRDVFSEEVTADNTLEQLPSVQARVEKVPKRIHSKKLTKYTPVQCKNGLKEDTSPLASVPFINSSLKNKLTRNTKKPITKVSMVDATTQTHATGEIMCFYSIHNADSD